MPNVTETAREIYTTGLRNQHAVEKQAVELLGRQLNRLENYPEMSERIRMHIDESEVQAQRLEQLLGGMDSSNSTFKDIMASIGGNVAAMAHMPAPDEVLKNTFANFAFEHFEIASYRSLLTLAEAVGHTEAKPLLEQSLQEEISMAKWIEDNISSTTLTYLERSAAGQTARV